jgi:hypothetical protein
MTERTPVTEYVVGWVGVGGVWIPESCGHFLVAGPPASVGYTLDTQEAEAKAQAIGYALKLSEIDSGTVFIIRRITIQEVWRTP